MKPFTTLKPRIGVRGQEELEEEEEAAPVVVVRLGHAEGDGWSLNPGVGMGGKRSWDAFRDEVGDGNSCRGI